MMVSYVRIGYVLMCFVFVGDRNANSVVEMVSRTFLKITLYFGVSGLVFWVPEHVL